MDVKVLKFWDYVIIALAMVGSILIGAYFQYKDRNQKNNEKYMLAGKSMTLIPVAISLMSTYISGVTVLGNASETYSNGLIYILVIFGSFIAAPIIMYLYLPVFYDLDIKSTYQYLEMRFGARIKILASLTFTIKMLMYNGIVLYMPTLAIEAVTGLDKHFCLLLIGVVSTIYSTTGGLKAVVWTDSLQTSLMFISLFVAFIFATIHVGGLANMFKSANIGGRLDFEVFTLDPTVRHSWFSLLCGSLFTALSLFAVNHIQVIRYKTLPTLKVAKEAVVMATLLKAVSNAVSCFLGVALFAVFLNCDPKSYGSISAYDQVLPYFVMQYISYIPGMAGLFMAGLMSASLSTLSTACNGLAGIAVEDYFSKWIDTTSLLWSKAVVILISVLIVGFSFIAERFGGLAQATVSIFGAFGGPLLGVFSLGMCTIFNNENGAIIGLLSGLLLNLWSILGYPRPSSTLLPFSTEGCVADSNINSTLLRSYQKSEFFYLYRISYQLYGMMGFLATITVGSIVSLLWRKEHPWEVRGEKFPDPRLFYTPLAQKISLEISKQFVDENKMKENYR